MRVATHLDRREHLGQKVRNSQAGPPDEVTGRSLDDRLEAEPVFVVARDHPLEEPRGLRGGHPPAQRVPPEGLLGVQGRQRLQIALGEGAQDEALGGQGRNRG